MYCHQKLIQKHEREVREYYKKITAKFTSLDPYQFMVEEGQECYFNPSTRQVFHPASVDRAVYRELVRMFPVSADPEDRAYDEETEAELRKYFKQCLTQAEAASQQEWERLYGKLE